MIYLSNCFEWMNEWMNDWIIVIITSGACLIRAWYICYLHTCKYVNIYVYICITYIYIYIYYTNISVILLIYYRQNGRYNNNNPWHGSARAEASSRFISYSLLTRFMCHAMSCYDRTRRILVCICTHSYSHSSCSHIHMHIYTHSRDR